MTNNVDHSFIKEMIAAEKNEELTIEEREFLLENESVLERIVDSLIFDLNYI
jgi:hypothetical protein